MAIIAIFKTANEKGRLTGKNNYEKSDFNSYNYFKLGGNRDVVKFIMWVEIGSEHHCGGHIV